MKQKKLTFIPGKQNPPGQGVRLAAIQLKDGAQVLLHAFYACQGGERRTTIQKRTPTIEQVNELGAELVRQYNAFPVMAESLEPAISFIEGFEQDQDDNETLKTVMVILRKLRAARDAAKG